MTRERIFGEDTPFGAWVRRRPNLDSILHGITVNDKDYMFHKYKDNVDGMGARMVHLMMNVEEKMYGAMPSKTQLQTLFFEHQLLNKKLPLKDVYGPGKIAVWHFGCFVVSMPATYPGEISDTVTWCRFDEKGRLIPTEITVDQLDGVLGFRLNPVTLDDLSLRRHHKEMKIVSTEKAPLGFPTERIITRRS